MFWVVKPGLAVGTPDQGWETPLHKAVSEGNALMVSALIAAGCDLESEFFRHTNSLDVDWSKRDVPRHRETALIAAIRTQNLEIMQLLLAAGANPSQNKSIQKDVSPLETVLRWFMNSDALKLLLAAGADLKYAANNYFPAHHDVSILSFGIHFKPDGDMHAQDAAAAEMTRCLIKAGVRNSVDINGAFKTAILQGYRIILGPLLEAGADLEAGIEFSENPPNGPHDDILPRGSKKWARTHRYLKKVKEAGGYENLVATYRRVLTAPESALAKFIEFRLGRAAPHDVVAKVLEFWKPPGGP